MITLRYAGSGRIPTMSPSLARSASTLFLALGLALAFLVPARGDDGKDQAKKTPKASSESAAAQTKGGAARQPGTSRVDKGKVGASAPVSAVSTPAKSVAAPGAKAVSFIRDVAPILVENCIAC